MNKPLTPEETAQTRRTLESMEARLLALLQRQPYELQAVTRKSVPPAVRVKLLLFIPVLTAAAVHGLIAAGDMRYWIDQQLSEIVGRPFLPFPFARHIRLLETLVIRGCLRRGELTLGDVTEDRVRLDEAEYRRRYGDEAYHRLITGTEDMPPQEEAA